MSQQKFDESLLKIKYGFYIDSDILTMPFSPREKKLLSCFQNNDSRLDQKAKEDVKFYLKTYPYLISVSFGSVGALCLYILDILVAKRYEEDAKKENKSSSKEESKPMSEAEKILYEKVLSKKQMKVSAQSSKLDYFQATKAMGEAPKKIEPLVLRLGKFRYLAMFSAFYLCGLMHGTLRSRVKVYELSKKYEKQVESYELIDENPSYL